MGRGLGPAQRTILDVLRSANGRATITELAGKLGRSERQVRTAVHALESRGLVVTEMGCVGWDGIGVRGPLREVNSYTGVDGHDDNGRRVPVMHPVVVLRPGDPYPGNPGYVFGTPAKPGPTWPGFWVYSREGMPVKGLFVYLPEIHALTQRKYDSIREALDAGAIDRDEAMNRLRLRAALGTLTKPDRELLAEWKAEAEEAQWMADYLGI